MYTFRTLNKQNVFSNMELSKMVSFEVYLTMLSVQTSLLYRFFNQYEANKKYLCQSSTVFHRYYCSVQSLTEVCVFPFMLGEFNVLCAGAGQKVSANGSVPQHEGDSNQEERADQRN